ncbi:hypothetical protein GKR56_16660 [Providencia alcalifaciens]|uniref:Uncharacterized protein n=1 Tax=Providencia alcalifaciens DSM 30120 TaxID=520999 RepID=B6XBA2_9GAMM|nr:hypothetical protein [Providencia alcalifaciens]ATG17831.1 hypothetical protein CO695_16545 [Providencia alcalifaciens]EEB47381.1 hypothetical protein PROVALCAL_00557 [Providencia alcalifaciens DSM 30120]ETT03803.1 hypothetical protein HMPREF1562_3773 [Providencia alcalifaciens F90-2004]EUC95178.1 hypothetical protein HMPREF1567_1631 [Providencia alcalifaciens PAL-2]MBF0690547.1 hypothetical protein [Providencia alcalifaciens]
MINEINKEFENDDINKESDEDTTKKGVFFILNSSGETINSIVVSHYSGLKGKKSTQKIDRLQNLEMADSGCEFIYKVMSGSDSDYWDVDFKTPTGKIISYRKNECNIRYWDNGVVIINVIKNFKLYIKFSESGGCHS